MTGPATPQEHRVAVRRVLSVLANGATIFSGTTESGRQLRILAPSKALARVPIVGEAWLVVGEARVSDQYGEQFHAISGRYAMPRGRLITRYLADHPDFGGIGEAKARRLWEAFGGDLATTISRRDIAALETVLTHAVAVRLVETWNEKKTEAETVDFLDARGFDWRLATALRRVWGDKVLEVLDRNPYHLLAFASWSKVDAAAMKLGVLQEDDRRLVGAVEASLYERLQHCHTVTDRATLLGLVAGRLKRKLAERAVDLAVAEGACIRIEQGYQAFGAASLETGITNRLRGMVAGERSLQGGLFPVEADAAWAESVIDRVERDQQFKLNAEQRTAVVLPFQHAFCLLTGGAGVGKTTVLRVVLELAHRQTLTVIQMALAGRAAQRMSKATGHPAMTIAKFLTAARAGTLDVSADCLVVIDEASMLDLPTMYRVLRILPDGARLMLVGDPAQLPPIGFGLVFHRLVGNTHVPQAHLSVVHRQAMSSGIPTVAADVRAHEVPDFVPYRGRHPGVSFIRCHADDVMKQLRIVAEAWRDDDWQVLAAVKGGRGGIRFINASFHAMASVDGEPSDRFLIGEPVIHLVNDYDRGLMNGSLGRIEGVEADGTLVIVFDGESHRIPASDIPNRIELAFAVSVHKAQGSQFGRVVIVIGKSKILDHALVYTALTRGVDQVVFIGDRTAFDEAIVSPPASLRRCVAFDL